VGIVLNQHQVLVEGNLLRIAPFELQQLKDSGRIKPNQNTVEVMAYPIVSGGSMMMDFSELKPEDRLRKFDDLLGRADTEAEKQKEFVKAYQIVHEGDIPTELVGEVAEYKPYDNNQISRLAFRPAVQAEKIFAQGILRNASTDDVSVSSPMKAAPEVSKWAFVRVPETTIKRYRATLNDEVQKISLTATIRPEQEDELQGSRSFKTYAQMQDLSLYRDKGIDFKQGYPVVQIKGKEYVLKTVVPDRLVETNPATIELRGNEKRTIFAVKLLDMMLKDPKFSDYKDLKVPDIQMVDVEFENGYTQKYIASEYIPEANTLYASKPKDVIQMKGKKYNEFLNTYLKQFLGVTDPQYIEVNGNLTFVDPETALAPVYFNDNSYNVNDYHFSGNPREYEKAANLIKSFVEENSATIRRLVQETGLDQDVDVAKLPRAGYSSVTADGVMNFLNIQAKGLVTDFAPSVDAKIAAFDGRYNSLDSSFVSGRFNRAETLANTTTINWPSSSSPIRLENYTRGYLDTLYPDLKEMAAALDRMAQSKDNFAIEAEKVRSLQEKVLQYPVLKRAKQNTQLPAQTAAEQEIQLVDNTIRHQVANKLTPLIMGLDLMKIKFNDLSDEDYNERITTMKKGINYNLSMLRKLAMLESNQEIPLDQVDLVDIERLTDPGDARV
ncbi:MAG: hypothetical protein KC733_00440, partial [Candidatus Omnitrophica bacterium]|nr:hypothetical protein [Candidatus Omnitrophota bacterium]